MFSRFPKYCWLDHSKCRLIVFAVLSASVMTLVLGAQASEEVPGAFALNVSGARPIGLNGAYVAIADDANAIWWNPAGTSQLGRTVFTSTHTSLYDVDGLSMSSLGFAKPTDVGALGVGVTYLRASDIPITDSNGSIIEYSVQSEEVLTLSYGNSLFNRLHLGASVRFLHSGQILDYSGLSLDLGLLANPARRFYLGAMLQQIASYLMVGDDGDSQKFPRNIKAAAAFRTGRLSVGLGLDNISLSNYREISAGCEVSPGDLVALRTGLRAGMRNETNLSWSAGIGLNLKKVHVDYAYTNQTSLASNHLISISLFID
ncbi:PorV/PorQ family protein [Candidatus Poribacteria bacterium]